MAESALSSWQLPVAQLQQMLPRVRSEYVNASPWPHAVITGLFPDDLIDQAAAECASISPEKFFRTADQNQLKEETASALGPVSQLLLAELDGVAFRRFASAVTGIPELLADGSHQWAGLHRTPRGGFTMIHRDFRQHPTSGLHHRVNALLYLNREWPPEYAGSLELWPPDMHAAAKRIAPLANTLILFETHDQTLHGFPDPVTCPEGQARLSLASYYFTVEAPARAVRQRKAVYVRRPQDSAVIGRRRFASFVGDFVPPTLKPRAQALLWRLRGLRGHSRGIADVPADVPQQRIRR